MNPAFRHSFDTQKEDTTKPGVTGSDRAVHGDDYREAGHIRNICFVWLDGKQVFLNYSYLVSGEFLPETNTIVLEFTSHVVKIGGFFLQSLFDSIMQQIAKKIISVDARYNALKGANEPIVNKIQIEKTTG